MLIAQVNIGAAVNKYANLASSVFKDLKTTMITAIINMNVFQDVV